ncbi:MAG: phosphatase PAP2 family protein [Magnetococcales bacterium]|nr:phosphatase PAP2 family protein [Magnetococcales bacterium]
MSVFSSYPVDFKPERPGKCFPAGHPSGGFAFMMLFFVFQSRRAKILGLLLGLTLGWVLGIYQMLKGAHFFSHVLVSMVVAWIIIVFIKRHTSQSPA